EMVYMRRWLVLFLAFVIIPVQATPQFSPWFTFYDEDLVYYPDVTEIRWELERVQERLPWLGDFSVYIVRQTGRFFNGKHLAGLYAQDGVYIYSLTATRLWPMSWLERHWREVALHEVGHLIWFRYLTYGERRRYAETVKVDPVEEFANQFARAWLDGEENAVTALLEEKVGE
ncbi:MAG: hypothetical protein ACPLRM_00385, partial [Anaerolineae bacterium]